MSRNETTEKTEATPARTHVGLVPLMLAMCAAVVVALGALAGAGWWLYTSGRLPELRAGRAVAKVRAEAPKPVLDEVALEPLLVNLADADGHSYLRVAITLVTEQKTPGSKAVDDKAAKHKPVNEFEAAERDALLDVLGRQTGERLLKPDGKDALKQQIRAALQTRVRGVTVDDVLFTDFLVQR